jgi:hypothetical protein
MSHFRNPNNGKIHAYDDDDPTQQPFIEKAKASGWKQINPPTVAAIPNWDLISEILKLEQTITPRRLREAILGVDNGWLQKTEKQIAALRSKFSG